MSLENLKKNDNILISTGNVLGFNKKVGQKPVEELIDCLSATFTNAEYHDSDGEIHQLKNDLLEKIEEYERGSLKIGAKIFINHFLPETIDQAVNGLLRILNVKCLDNVILAYHPMKESDPVTTSPANVINSHANDINVKMNGETTPEKKLMEGDAFEWAPGKDENTFMELKELWKSLEKFNKEKKVCQLGISDLDTETLKRLYENCDVKPTIAKINLTACCVVPPSLQEFCNTNDIQLLTHSDPEVFLKENSLKQWDLEEFNPTWVMRYQVHVKCRGLLCAKGYLVGASKSFKENQ